MNIVIMAAYFVPRSIVRFAWDIHAGGPTGVHLKLPTLYHSTVFGNISACFCRVTAEGSSL